MIPIYNGIKIIRRKLSLKQTLTIVTAQALTVLYYGVCIWLTPVILRSQLQKVERLHYKCVRLVLKDYKQRNSDRQGNRDFRLHSGPVSTCVISS